MKWKLTKIGLPPQAVTVALTNNPGRASRDAATVFTGFLDETSMRQFRPRSGAEPFSPQPTHWAELPTEFEEEPKIVLNELGTDRVVEFNADGSVGVGCVKVSSEQFDAIAKRRKEVSGK